MTHKTPLGCRNDFTELHHPGGDRPSMFSGLNVLEDRAKKKITFVFQYIYIHDTPKIRKQIKHTGDREDRVKLINTLFPTNAARYLCKLVFKIRVCDEFKLQHDALCAVIYILQSSYHKCRNRNRKSVRAAACLHFISPSRLVRREATNFVF